MLENRQVYGAHLSQSDENSDYAIQALDLISVSLNELEMVTIKREELEKYISELSPEMQEKARQCKDMQELNALLAENEVELSEDALEAVSGGCSMSSYCYDQGDITPAVCPLCGNKLYYWDMLNECVTEGKTVYQTMTRLYCQNPSCSSYNNGLWYVGSNYSGVVGPYNKVYKY